MRRAPLTVKQVLTILWSAVLLMISSERINRPHANDFDGATIRKVLA